MTDPKYLTEAQVQQLFDAGDGAPEGERRAFKLMYLGLLRVSEVCKLRVRDLVIDERLIRVVKGKGGDRHVGIGDTFAPELAGSVENKKPDDFVVTAEDGQPFTRFKLDKRLERDFADQAGFGRSQDGSFPLGFRIHCHTLRHSGARAYLRQGILDIDELRDMLGHADLTSTSIYLKTLGERIREKLKRKELRL